MFKSDSKIHTYTHARTHAQTSAFCFYLNACLELKFSLQTDLFQQKIKKT